MRGSIEVCKEAGREKLGAAWSPECEAERLDLIAALTSSNEGPLVPPDFSKPFRIAVDAGMLPGGVGVVLEQVQPNGSVRPVGFASKALTKVQMRWATSQIEAYAIVFGLRTFRWALNPAFPHTIVSDHRALKWLKDVSKEETAGNRQLKRFACEVENYGPYLFEFRAGALNGAADGLSRVVSTDRTIDGRRDREESAANDLSSPSPNLWEEVDSVTEAYFQTVLEEAVPLCRADPEWAPWLADGEQLDSIEHELRRQLRERRLVERTFLSREQVAHVEAVLDQTPLLSQWATALQWGIDKRVPINMTNAVFGNVAPVPEEDQAAASLEALLSAGIMGAESRPDHDVVGVVDGAGATESVPLPQARQAVPSPDAEMADALPTLAAAQRLDPVWGEVMAFLEAAVSDRPAAWKARTFEADGHDDEVGAEGKAPLPRPLSTVTLLELASVCFIDGSGVLRRRRVTVRSQHSVKIRGESSDRGVICVPRSLRQPILSLYHGGNSHTGSGRLMDALSNEFFWVTMSSDCRKFVDQCHVCSSYKAGRTSKQVPVGTYNVCLTPGDEVTGDILGPLPETPDGFKYLMVFIDRASRWAEAYPLKNNNSEEMLEALLTFIWRRGCPKILFSDRGGNLLSLLASKVYERLGIKKESAAAYRFKRSSRCCRARSQANSIIRPGSCGCQLFYGP
jgi:hypothetical protein